jgi:hypothetical protein
MVSARATREGALMYAAIRRYEGADAGRREEIRQVINDDFLPIIREMPGYHGYWVIQTDDVLATVSLFETQGDAEESTRLAAEVIRDRNLQDALPNPPQVTAGEVTVAGPVHALT